jgi:hypothetical protein
MKYESTKHALIHHILKTQERKIKYSRLELCPYFARAFLGSMRNLSLLAWKKNRRKDCCEIINCAESHARHAVMAQKAVIMQQQKGVCRSPALCILPNGARLSLSLALKTQRAADE